MWNKANKLQSCTRHYGGRSGVAGKIFKYQETIQLQSIPFFLCVKGK